MSEQIERENIFKEELAGKDLVELVQMLDEIPEPEPVSMVPQTIGWLVVGGLLLLLLIWLGKRWYRKFQADGYRRAAIKAVRSANHNPVQLAGIVRRTALCAFPREKVSKLHGDQWLDFLNTSYGGNEFLSHPGYLIATAPYRRTEAVPELSILVEKWIRNHRSSNQIPQGK